MKFEEPDSDRSAEVSLRADGSICTEYICPRDEIDDTHCCYVPVAAGQSISVDCSFRGTTNQVNFDLFVDGILRNSQTITHQSWRTTKRVIKFSSGFFVNEDAEISEGDLRVLNLDTANNCLYRTGGAEAVGVIEVRLSAFRSAKEVQHDLGEAPNFKNSKGWRVDFDRPSWSLIKPTHEIALYQREEQPQKKALSRIQHRVQSDSKRPGTEAWLTVRFFYRSLRRLPVHLLHWPANTK